MGKSSFFGEPVAYDVVDEGGEGSGFYEGPAYTQIDPVAIANSVAAAAASASAAASAQAAVAASAASAADSAADALASENAADASEAAAASSATAAAGSASTASTQATNAATSATNAGNSATAAAGSASSASTSATTAATQAGNASSSASAAATSASAASSSASAAATSATNAATSETNAATSASSAASSASTASTSASNAASSASAASGSASSASTSETNAGNSATAAAGSASSASTSASAATTQAGNAASSASAAATSASNAATSETNAAASEAAVASALSTKADKSTTVSAGGIATGGGDLSANRTITVPKSSSVQALAGTDDATAMTPVRVAEAISAAVGAAGVSSYNSRIGSVVTTAADIGAGSTMLNGSLTGTVASNALTINVKSAAGNTPASGAGAVLLPFRSSGAVVLRTVTSSLSIVIPSGTTIGTKAALNSPIYVYAIDNAGTPELAVSCRYFGASGIVTTVAVSGGGTATTMYSTTARTSKSFVCLGVMYSTQTTAGTWASTPTPIELYPFAFKRYSIRMGLSSNQSTSAATYSRVGLNVVNTDTDGCWDAANYRFVCREPGTYTFVGITASNSGGAAQHLLRMNGNQLSLTASASNLGGVSVSSVVDLVPGDYIELWQYTAAADAVYADFTAFSGALISR